MATASGSHSNDTSMDSETLSNEQLNDASMSPVRQEETDALNYGSGEEEEDEGFRMIKTDLKEPDLEGFVSQYDGRELHVHRKALVVGEDGLSVMCMEREVRDCVIEFLTAEDYQSLPPNWLLFYNETEAGLQCHTGFRKAIFDCEMAYRAGRLPNLPVLLPNESEIGITGVDVSQEVLYREPEKRRKPQSVDDWKALAAKTKRPKLYSLGVGELYSFVTENECTYEEAISALIREGKSSLHKPYNPSENDERSAAEEKARLAKIRKGKQLSGKTKGQKGSGTDSDSSVKKGRSKDGKKGKKDGSETDSDGFQPVLSEREKRGNRKLLVNVGTVEKVTKKVNKEPKPVKEDSRVDEPQSINKDTLAGMQAAAAEGVKGVIGKLKKKLDDSHDPDEDEDPMETEGKEEEKEEETDKPDDEIGEDIPIDQAAEREKDRLKEIYDNASGLFKTFIPASFEECAMSSKKYACPEPRNMEEESDDEDWLRETESDTLPSEHYVEWFAQLNKLPDSYYTRDQKWKLRWVYKKWYVEEGNQTCPFTTCEKEKKGKTYSSPRRFLRHLCEAHMHHTIVYECTNRHEQRDSLSCNGCITPRRGAMVRHYKWCHSPGMKAARNRILNLHELVLAKYKKLTTDDFRQIDVQTEMYSEVYDAKNGKLSARLALVKSKGKFDLSPPLFDLVREFRGDPPRTDEQKRWTVSKVARTALAKG